MEAEWRMEEAEARCLLLPVVGRFRFREDVVEVTSSDDGASGKVWRMWPAAAADDFGFSEEKSIGSGDATAVGDMTGVASQTRIKSPSAPPTTVDDEGHGDGVAKLLELALLLDSGSDVSFFAPCGTGCSTRRSCEDGTCCRLLRCRCCCCCCCGGGEMGGENIGELNPLWCGGGDAMKLGVVLPEPKNISLDGVARADDDAAGLHTTLESNTLRPPLSAFLRGATCRC